MMGGEVECERAENCVGGYGPGCCQWSESDRRKFLRDAAQNMNLGGRDQVEVIAEAVEYAIREFAARSAHALRDMAGAHMGLKGSQDPVGVTIWNCASWLEEKSVDAVLADLVANPAGRSEAKS